MRPERIIAAILAGGASRRMGTDKAELRVAGETLLERTARIARQCLPEVQVIGRDRPQDWRGPEVAFRRDQHPGAGPLAALLDALAAGKGVAVLVMPCDLPLLTPAVFAWLIAAPTGQHGLLATRGGALEPLCGIYHATSALPLGNAFAQGERSCWRAVAACAMAHAEIPPELYGGIKDCDTPQDWARLVSGDAHGRSVAVL